MATKRPTTRHDWKIHPMPDGAERLDWQRTLSPEECRLLRLGFIPDAPTDDWFAFFEDDQFFIHWKQTGHCICSFRLKEAGGGQYEIADVRLNRRLLPGVLPGDGSKVAGALDGILTDLLEWIDRTEKPAGRDSWHNTVPMPKKHTRLDMHIVIPAGRYEKLRWGYIPRVMEDHWFYYMDGEWLYFHRSWTGHCIFQVKLKADKGSYKVSEIRVNGDESQYLGSDQQSRNLIRGLLLEW